LKEIEERVLPKPIPSNIAFVVRLDGVSFKKFTSGLKKPIDDRLADAMVETTKDLVLRFNALSGFVVSDEISLVFPAAEPDEVKPDEMKSDEVKPENENNEEGEGKNDTENGAPSTSNTPETPGTPVVSGTPSPESNQMNMNDNKNDNDNNDKNSTTTNSTISTTTSITTATASTTTSTTTTTSPAMDTSNTTASNTPEMNNVDVNGNEIANNGVDTSNGAVQPVNDNVDQNSTDVVTNENATHTEQDNKDNNGDATNGGDVNDSNSTTSENGQPVKKKKKNPPLPRVHAYSGRPTKLASITAGYASARLNHHLHKYEFEDVEPEVRERMHSNTGHFDGRALPCPTKKDVFELVLWRHLDGFRNSMTGIGRKHFSHALIHGKSGRTIARLVKEQEGKSIFDLYPPRFFFGTLIKREKYKQRKYVDPRTGQVVSSDTWRRRPRTGSFEWVLHAEALENMLLEENWTDTSVPKDPIPEELELSDPNNSENSESSPPSAETPSQTETSVKTKEIGVDN